MSRSTATATGREHDRSGRLRRAVTLGGDRPLATTVGLVALAPVAALTLARLLRNSPAGLPAAVREAVPVLTTLAAVVPAFAFLALGAAADRRPARTAHLALGVFPAMAVATDGAWLAAAAVVAVVSAAALALALRDRATGDGSATLSVEGLAPAVVSVFGVAAIAASLAGAAGIAPLTLLPLGAAAAFATLAALALGRLTDGVDLLVWVGAAVAVGWWAIGAPFVAGAVTLVAFGAGQVPFVLLVLGVGGAVAVSVAALRRGAVGPAVGALLLLFAGVPGRLPRAVAFALGLVVLVRTWDAGRPDATAASAGTATTSGGGTDA